MIDFDLMFLKGLVGALIILIVTCFFGLGNYFADIHSNCKTVTIQLIGGCSLSGKCGIKADDGEFYTVEYPVIGQTRKVCDVNRY